MSIQHSTLPAAIFGCLRSHHGLVWELVKREFFGRYKGSIIGMAWSLLHPLLMLTVYTLVFSVAFKARWGAGDESKVTFALALFSGMIVYNLFVECLNRAPTLISSKPNYVKKVIFPLEIFPWVILLSALLHFLVSLGILLIFCIAAGISLNATVLFIPLIILPVILIALGLTWLLASLGVYLRDISQSIGIISTVLLFLSPVFYKTSSFPEKYQIFFALNPVALPIEQLRGVLLFGQPVDWMSWAVSLVVGCIIVYLGFWWFQKSRKGFADVI